MFLVFSCSLCALCLFLSFVRSLSVCICLESFFFHCYILLSFLFSFRFVFHFVLSFFLSFFLADLLTHFLSFFYAGMVLTIRSVSPSSPKPLGLWIKYPKKIWKRADILLWLPKFVRISLGVRGF